MKTIAVIVGTLIVIVALVTVCSLFYAAGFDEGRRVGEREWQHAYYHNREAIGCFPDRKPGSQTHFGVPSPAAKPAEIKPCQLCSDPNALEDYLAHERFKRRREMNDELHGHMCR